MSLFEFPLINGIAPSWSDIAVRLTPTGGLGALIGALAGNLLEIGDIYSIDSGWEVEVGEQREGGRVIKRTTGSIKHTASASFYASGYKKLITGLIAGAPRNGNQVQIALATFTLSVIWSPPGSVEIFERRIKGCRLTGNTVSASEGTDAQRVDVTLNPLQVVDVIDGQEVVGI